jgi:hypothetical protein
MQVHAIRTPHVEVLHPDASLTEATKKMSQLDVGPLPSVTASDSSVC